MWLKNRQPLKDCRFPVPRALWGLPCRETDVQTAKKQHLRVCRCLENGMDMGAGTILSMTIIAWGNFPVNRNDVPVFAEITPFLCQFGKCWLKCKEGEDIIEVDKG